MKTVYKITTILCIFIAAVSIIIGIKLLMGSSFGFTWYMVRMVRMKGFMGVIGGLIGIIFSVCGFGIMGWAGIKNDVLSRRVGLIAGIVMTAVSVLSIIGALIGHSASGGDLIMLAIPALYTISLVMTA